MAYDAEPVVPSNAELAIMDAAQRAALDVARLQALIAPFAPRGLPILIVTALAIESASKGLAVGRDAADLLLRIARIQGIWSAKGAPWRHPLVARELLRRMISTIGHKSAAYPDFNVIYIDLMGYAASTAALTGALPYGDAIRAVVDYVTLHELGHHVEVRRGLRLEHAAFEMLPPRMRRSAKLHAQETFAEAFAVTAMRRSGWPAEVPRGLAMREAAGWLCGLQPDREAPGKDVPSTSLRGVYCTMGAALAAAAAPVSKRASASTIAEIARDAARHGALPADLLDAVEQGGLPDTLWHLDATGAARKILAAESRRTDADRAPWRPKSVEAAGLGCLERLIRLDSLCGAFPSLRLRRVIEIERMSLVLRWGRNQLADASWVEIMQSAA